jgi:hypothetical protein
VYSLATTRPNYSILTARMLPSWTPSTVVPTRKWSRTSRPDRSGSKKKLPVSKNRNRLYRRSLTYSKSQKRILRKKRSLDLDLQPVERPRQN